MSVETAELIAQDLKVIDFKGRLGLSGFGEPLLNPHLWKICWVLHNCTGSLEIVTNGDLLTKDVIESLYHAGVSLITVNIYDNTPVEKFEEMFDGWIKDAYRIRVHRQGDGLILNNRGGTLFESKTLQRPCYLPFYKLMIDYDGSYLVCSNDWKRETRSKLNVQNMSIFAYWCTQLEEHRKNLLRGNRNIDACRHCDCNGTLVGKEQFEYWRQRYETFEQK
jgi:MoaA/NifB/PqqE/SkfB family radical SAM enzyme